MDANSWEIQQFLAWGYGGDFNSDDAIFSNFPICWLFILVSDVQIELMAYTNYNTTTLVTLLKFFVPSPSIWSLTCCLLWDRHIATHNFVHAKNIGILSLILVRAIQIKSMACTNFHAIKMVTFLKLFNLLRTIWSHTWYFS